MPAPILLSQSDSYILSDGSSRRNKLGDEDEDEDDGGCREQDAADAADAVNAADDDDEDNNTAVKDDGGDTKVEDEFIGSKAVAISSLAPWAYALTFSTGGSSIAEEASAGGATEEGWHSRTEPVPLMNRE